LEKTNFAKKMFDIVFLKNFAHLNNYPRTS